MFVQADGPAYQVETGRKDGMISDISKADEMPDVDDSIQILKQKFQDKGFTPKDLVVLSGMCMCMCFAFLSFHHHHLFLSLPFSLSSHDIHTYICMSFDGFFLFFEVG